MTTQFSGTAQYYTRYRLDYPEELLQQIRDAFGLDGVGRLLDVGCGTGKLTIPLSKYFEHTVAVDPEADMLAELGEQCRAFGLDSIQIIQAKAESLRPEALGAFRLISSGDAFHWMERDTVLNLWHKMVSVDGGLAIVGTGGGAMNGSSDWESAIWSVIQRWLGPGRRNAPPDPRPFEQSLSQNGRFSIFSSGHMNFSFIRDIDSILGFLYSTSFCNKALLGENVPRFEEDLRRTLLKLEPKGTFVQYASAQYLLARPVR